MRYYDNFVIPFAIGTAVLFATLGYKYIRWYVKLPAEDKRLFRRGLLSPKAVQAAGEMVSESLLHRRIFRVNPLLGYMHMSLAFGWFLLIAVGWIETTVLTGDLFVPLHAHVFFRYFSTGLDHTSAVAELFAFLMDLLLLFVLTGVALAWAKRVRSRMMGLRRTTRHVTGDRVALTALWFIFPVRLLAESATCGLYGGGSFLTGSLGGFMAQHIPHAALDNIHTLLWWTYSIVLGTFFVALPFSRYMHIFTELPLILMRRCGLRSSEKQSSFDHFQIEACSRCGICIDPCQLQSQAGYDDVQSVYFLRDRRYGNLSRRVADNCLMCGRCESRCPVGIELNTLRLNSRADFINDTNDKRYSYLAGQDRSSGQGRTGYFAGCMTRLTPRTLKAMESIFAAAGEDVWWADRDGGACCGRPLKLAGEVDAARKMMEFNAALIRNHGITTLVTSCPICLKVFKEDYALEGVEVLHHSQYILRLMEQGRIATVPSGKTFTYHDPCELGRKGGIYDEPRAVIGRMGTLVEPAQTRENAPCCGSSVANIAIDDRHQATIASAVAREYASTGADTLVTACPLCKKALVRGATQPVADLAEIVAESIRH